MQGKRRDPGKRVKAEVHKNYRGIHLYVPLEWLKAAGVADNGSPVYYRIWASRGGSLLVRLYSEP